MRLNLPFRFWNSSLGVGTCLFLVSIWSGNTFAQSTPSNQELYNLIVNQRNEISELRQRAETAVKLLQELQNDLLPAQNVVSGSQPTVINRSATEDIIQPGIGAQKRRQGAWSTSVQATAMVVSSDALTVVNGDSGNADTKDADAMDAGISPGVDVRMAYAMPDSRLTLGVTGKFWQTSLSQNFSGTDIQPSIGLEDDEILSNELKVDMDMTKFVGDIDATYDLINNGDIDLGLIFGVRGALFANHAQYAVIQDGTDTARKKVDSKTRFYGLGPRLGFTGNVDFGGGFGFEGGSTASILFGRDSTRTYESTESDTGVFDENRFVPLVDMKFALSYEKKFDRVTTELRLGGQAEWWSNVSDHFRTKASSAPVKSSGQDYLFFGPFAGVKATW